MCWAEHAGPGRIVCDAVCEGGDGEFGDGELAAPAVRAVPKVAGAPRHAVEPLYDPRLPFTMQIRDNDPSVLGGFNYTLCRQSSVRALGNLVSWGGGGGEVANASLAAATATITTTTTVTPTNDH